MRLSRKALLLHVSVTAIILLLVGLFLAAALPRELSLTIRGQVRGYTRLIDDYLAQFFGGL